MKIGKARVQKEQINAHNLLDSTFFKEKRHLTDGFLGKEGLRKLKKQISLRREANKKIQCMNYLSGPKMN